MGHSLGRTATIALLLAAVLLAGCAGTARGQRGSVYQPDAAVAMVDVSRSEADAMVVIRYPAIVHEDAVAAYYQAFEQQAIGGAAKIDAQSRPDTDRIAQSLIAKSNYFAMSLYRELGAGLPPQSVLLSPHLLELEDGRLVSRPLLASEQVPSVLSIDFNVYSHPDPDKMMDSEPLTFGDIVTPLFVIHANRWLRPPTHGLLLSSEALLPTAWAQSERQAGGQVEARLRGEEPSFRRPLDFVTFLDGATVPPRDLPVKSAGESRREVVAVEAHPLEKIRMDGDRVARLALDQSVDPFAQDFVKGAATRVIEALNRADHDRATFFTRQAALARFDPQLGDALLARRGDEATLARLRMAEALLTAERKFLAAQSDGLYEGTYEGVYGDQMREMIAAEYRMLEERRELARTQNIGTALAIVAAVGAVYVGNNADASDYYASRTASNLLALSSVWAASSAFSANAQSKTIGENFLVQMAPAINRQVTVQVEWLESREQITARDFAGFREQTLALYQRSARSIPQAADPLCRFGYPPLGAEGRWYGACEDGLAAGSGYGVAVGDGYAVEYVGTADAGLAEGSGAMIVNERRATGAVYLEGSFAAGVADGVVWVEEPGRKPRVRSFRQGRDVGQAALDSLQRVHF